MSPYFDRILSLSMREGENRRIVLGDGDDDESMPAPVVRAVIRYLYSRSVDGIVELADNNSTSTEQHLEAEDNGSSSGAGKGKGRAKAKKRKRTATGAAKHIEMKGSACVASHFQLAELETWAAAKAGLSLTLGSVFSCISFAHNRSLDALKADCLQFIFDYQDLTLKDQSFIDLMQTNPALVVEVAQFFGTLARGHSSSNGGGEAVS